MGTTFQILTTEQSQYVQLICERNEQWFNWIKYIAKIIICKMVRSYFLMSGEDDCHSHSLNIL